MKVLGLNYYHDGGAALVVDGKLVAAAEEERFDRVRHSWNKPVNALNYCLRTAGLALEDIDVVATPWKNERLARLAEPQFRRTPSTFAWALGKILWNRHEKVGKQNNFAREFFGPKPEVVNVSHHAAHAATAFYPSGFRDATVLSVDGSGILDATTSWKGEGNGMKRLRDKSAFESLGFLYQALTMYVGFSEWDAGKTMGLAPYGQKEPGVMRKLRQVLDTESPDGWYSMSPKLHRNLLIEWRTLQQFLGFPPNARAQGVLGKPYVDVAHAAQHLLERALLHLSETEVAGTGSDKVCLSGGVALNCVANSVILNSNKVSDVFAFPAAHDGGVFIGAALKAAADAGEKVSFKMEHAYYGPEYSAKETEAALKGAGLKYEECRDIEGRAAELLAENNILGWVQGRMEIGPRALGNRSILGNPTNKAFWEKMNIVKGREVWRPLAPSLLYEAREEYLEHGIESPFMILADQVPEKKRREIPVVVHVDGSTRPQTVRKEVNPRYWKLIKAFEDCGGVPVVVNTSFNQRGEPIVCSPQDAINTFHHIKLDALALGDFLVLRRDNPQLG